jgi:UDP-N-acetylmuramoyl-L-alanyl-D-glutamate--2,6-diaminopimelate ligase
MEVTSHALDQHRVAEIEYDVAVFSNLTLDHLDYHHTMEEYCKAKNRLFQHLGRGEIKKRHVKAAVINGDSPWHTQITSGCQQPILTYSIEGKADLQASHIQLDQRGTLLQLTYQGKTTPCHFPLVGRFNIYNCLAAIGVALTRNYSLESILERMTTLPPIRGRLEPVQNALNLKIYVDFAHSDDALSNVLSCLNELKKEGRIITVFGCGGDRDQSKRPKMAEVSEQLSNFTIVTSDNPRSENPEAICQAIARGFKKKESYTIELDRRQAIQKAIEIATPKDIILIAGKGHETYQIFAHKTVEFDDCKVAADICSLKQ